MLGRLGVTYAGTLYSSWPGDLRSGPSPPAPKPPSPLPHTHPPLLPPYRSIHGLSGVVSSRHWAACPTREQPLSRPLLSPTPTHPPLLPPPYRSIRGLSGVSFAGLQTRGRLENCQVVGTVRGRGMGVHITAGGDPLVSSCW